VLQAPFITMIVNGPLQKIERVKKYRVIGKQDDGNGAPGRVHCNTATRFAVRQL
jgi:hypothetical protein